MKFKIVLFLIFSSSISLFGQECDCLKNITILQQKIENNQASYQHQVIEQKRLNEYFLFRTEINSKAKTIATKKGCIGLVSLYLSFFHDEHSFISYENNYAPKPNKIIKPNRKRIYTSLPFEGIWYFQDGSFSIDIFQTKNTMGEWVGVIKNDNSKSWKKGQIKIEFINNENGSLSCIYWRKNLIPQTYDLHLTDSTMIIGRNLIFYRKPQVEQNTTINTNDLLFRQLSEQTNYLKLPSFDLSFKNKIDSLIANNRIGITSKKNLVIDVRNNGGGGFDAFQSILPYLLDKNLTETPYYGSVWVSKDNYDYYNRTKYEYTESKQDSINELKYVEYLKEYLNCFTPIEKEIDTIELEKNSPLNIAILFNRNTASSAEGFILQASSSKKVKTFGENSKGAVSYGDWMPMDLPELNIWVAITTKKMIFNNNENFESIGISPDIDLKYTNESEWLNIVLKQLEK
ncbi:MAG TPA: S41 family peptidase [Sediminibacterium sp.]|uniref:S41 family peptidase n=1 Tax=Sediminibacterium sp. TaxID=1917865 RepID=UPI0026A103A7|nr:S41 family peptidase [Sediminibacterium sp.]HLD52407.1 S41 family peptidase [Sediminibacterium sp.]